MREKAVREAEIWPRWEGVRGLLVEERSREREVDCFKAVLKRVFWER